MPSISLILVINVQRDLQCHKVARRRREFELLVVEDGLLKAIIAPSITHATIVLKKHADGYLITRVSSVIKRSNNWTICHYSHACYY